MIGWDGGGMRGGRGMIGCSVGGGGWAGEDEGGGYVHLFLTLLFVDFR